MKKKISIFLLASALILALSSCKANKIKIEDYEWQMRYVMHVVDEQLVMDAIHEADSAHPDAKIISMTLTANGGKLTITDKTNDVTYEGTYLVKQRTPDGIDYQITIDGKSGYATVAMTTYADGSQEPTLPINLGDYSMCFYAD